MDFLTVQEVIQDIPAEYDILIRFNESFEDSESGVPINKEYKAFIAETNGQAVGVAVLEKFTFASTVSDQFDIEEFVNLDVTPLDGQHLLLRHMILNPFFMQQSRWFTEEIMRMAGVSCMLYMVDETSKSDVCTKALMSKQFIPVNRRKQIIFEDNLRDGVSVSEQLPFNIQIITNSFLYEPKLEVNTKIVVVGGSDTGIAFLEKLIYTTHLHFSNITLISTAGVPSKLNSESFVDHKCYSNIDLKQIGLEHYIRIVQASTTELDRVLKRVRLDDDSFISYDYLFLTPGVQFFSSSINEDFSNLNGVFNLNPRSYASYMQASMKLLGRDDAQTGRIVIYGRDLQVFVTFQELIKKGISPSWIVVVIPPPTEPTNCFDNATVENMVLNRLTSVGAQVLIDFKVSQWRSSPSGALESVAFLRKFDKLEIAVDQAEVFLYGDLKSVDPDTFMSINDSCLVFDAKLVIDKFCRTQDPYVFAAGSITKFSSRYQTKWTHGYLDSKEVGKKLAEIVLPLFDPTKISPSLEDNNKVVKFADAKKKYAVLPGNLVYLHFDEPRLPSHSFEFVKKQANYGRDLVINTDTLGYFRIRVDPFGFIRSLTYLGERRIPVENYLCLYGLNEKYLNGLVSRFDEGIISDFVSFLSETWALPIFHDRFPNFIKQCRIDMMKHDGPEIKDIVEQIKEIGLDGQPIKDLERDDLVKQFQASLDRNIWDTQMFQFFLDTKSSNSSQFVAVRGLETVDAGRPSKPREDQFGLSSENQYNCDESTAPSSHHRLQHAESDSASKSDRECEDKKSPKSHKEVEKRRREKISSGIAELALLVPGADGQRKGRVVERAIEYMIQLQEKEQRSLESWNVQKMMLDDRIEILNGQILEFRRSNAQLRSEIAKYHM
ncbi:hypothetical protein HDU83_000671 [Entophlyctis luteolus]|nr:hypothetical protein HDU83_000671 [Entophlyctis luteolus]